MAEYTGSADIYKELVEDSNENWLYGLVAFAIVEEQRIEWMRHFEECNGRAPDDNDVRNWYKQQPASVILRAKGTAENALQVYSAEVVDVALDEKRREIEEGIVITEIRESRKFWPQFGVNFIGGFASAVVFAALLILVAFFVFEDASPTQIGAQLRNNIEEIGNGQN
jgi:hypothetical protein